MFVFANPPLLKQQRWLADIRAAYPRAHLLGCSAAGTICDTRVVDDAVVTTAVAFDHTEIKGACVPIVATEQSYEAGEQLARALPLDGLVHVFVLSDGLNVNGSELVRGLTEHLPPHVAVTGGLSGDDDRFQETYVRWDDTPEKSTVAAVGLYGERLKVGYGSLGGWDPVGREQGNRTKSGMSGIDE